MTQKRRSLAFVALCLVGIAVSGILFFGSAQIWYNATFPRGEYAKQCKSAGVTFLQAPRTLVKSVALDYVPVSATREWRQYEVANNLVTSAGSLNWHPRMERQLERFELRDELFYRYPNSKPFVRWDQAHRDQPTPESELTSDVLVLDTVSNENELTNALWNQGMVAHHLVVTDRRNGDRLATMNYVVDLRNKRACGANVEDGIDVDAFVLRAAQVPVLVPAYERERLARLDARRYETPITAAILVLGAIAFWLFRRDHGRPTNR